MTLPILPSERLQMEANAARAILTPEECRRFERNLDRAREGKPSINPTPRLDAREIRENVAEKVAARDRRIDSWHQVLEYFGFHFYQPKELDRIFGMLEQEVTGIDAGETIIAYIPHREGEWRRTRAPKKTFTTNDIVTLFETPFDFDRWMRAEILKWRRLHESIKVVSR